MHSIFKTRMDLEGKPIDENAEKGGQSVMLLLYLIFYVCWVVPSRLQHRKE